VPWSFSEARASFVAWISGAALLLVCWWESSGTGRVSKQTTWANVAVASIAMISIASIMWVASGRRAVRARRSQLNDRLEKLGSTVPASERAVIFVEDQPLTVSGTSRYHRSDCLLIAEKKAYFAPTDVIESGDLQPCEMCRP
jgi:hypothetical protein